MYERIRARGTNTVHGINPNEGLQAQRQPTTPIGHLTQRVEINPKSITNIKIISDAITPK